MLDTPQPAEASPTAPLAETSVPSPWRVPLAMGWARAQNGPALLAMAILLLLVGYATYLFVFASRIYAVDVRFAVRQADIVRPQQGPSLLGGAMIATLTESNAVVHYLRSRDALDGIEARMPIRRLFSREGIDPFQRLPPDAAPERALRYVNGMVRPYFDHTSGIVSVEVRAFSPDEAWELAMLVESLAENLVNRMSVRARQGLLAAVERDVAEAERHVSALRDRQRDFRERNARLDPRRNAAAADELRARLEFEIATQRAVLDQQRRFMSEATPALAQQRERVEALQRELREQVRRGTAAEDAALPAALREFEALEFAVANAQKSFDAALTSLERARSDANRQQIYLSPIVHPSLPVQAAYPRPWRDLLTAAALASLAGLLLLLLTRTLREHML
jgi:capsular polysaccharide transport system permease protein